MLMKLNNNLLILTHIFSENSFSSMKFQRLFFFGGRVTLKKKTYGSDEYVIWTWF